MTHRIATEHFSSVIGSALEETFESVHGIYLDRGTSLFETLATISAEEASIPVGGKCATLAAQVEHVGFYLEVLMQYMVGPPPQSVDWDEIWRTVSSVSEEEWADSQKRLRETYEQVTDLIDGIDRWDTQELVGGPVAIIAHTAYHLGEIRQALCVLKQ
jgi:hypothetical protein